VFGSARTVAAGQILQVNSTPTSKKRTQTNPLRLSPSESARYVTFGKNEPIEVKSHIFNVLGRKRCRFLKNMDENASITTPDSGKSETEKWKSENDRMANETGMLLNLGRLPLVVACTIPDSTAGGPGSRIVGLGGMAGHWQRRSCWRLLAGWPKAGLRWSLLVPPEPPSPRPNGVSAGPGGWGIGLPRPEKRGGTTVSLTGMDPK